MTQHHRRRFHVGGINLEDIAAPKCFLIEERLRKELEEPTPVGAFPLEAHTNGRVLTASGTR